MHHEEHTVPPKVLQSLEERRRKPLLRTQLLWQRRRRERELVFQKRSARDKGLRLLVPLPPLVYGRSVDVLPPIACHGGTQGSMFGLQRMWNSTVNARDSRFILVWPLDCDRVTALRPVGVCLALD